MIRGFFTAINKQKNMFFFYLVAMILSVILDFAVLKAGYGLVSIVYVAALVSFLLGSSLFIYASSFYFERWLSRIFVCIKMYFPFVYILGITLVLDLFMKDNHSLFHDLSFVFLKVAVLIVSSVLFILHLDRSTGLTREIVQLLRSKLDTLFIGNVTSETHI